LNPFLNRSKVIGYRNYINTINFLEKGRLFVKKILFTIFLSSAILSNSDTCAQLKFSLGPRAGINLAKLSFDPDTPEGIDKSGRLGFKFGALAELGFSQMFAVQIEPMYVMKGAELEGTVLGQHAKETFKLSFIEIPVLVKVKFPTGSVTPYIFAGPDIGLLLSSDDETEFRSESEKRDVKDETSSIDFAIDFGAGVGFAAGPGVVLVFDVRYALGLRNLYNPKQETQSEDQTIKSTGIQILIGAAFTLN
jgi:hypothetical protein